MDLSWRRDGRVLFALLLIAAGTRLVYFNGLFGHDDWMYLFYTRSLFNGITDEIGRSGWGLRYGVWLPIAASFKLFGVGYQQAFVPSFAFGLGSVAVAYCCALALNCSRLSATLAGLVATFNPLDWMTATTIRGDIETSCLGGLVLLTLLLARRAQGRRYLLFLASGAIWGWSVITKEWCYLFGFGYGAVFVYDWVRSRRVPLEYGWIGAAFLLILGLDCLVSWQLSGMPLARFTIAAGHFHDNAAGDPQGWVSDRSWRLGYLPSIVLGIRNEYWQHGRFVNGYPDLGCFLWPLLPAIAVLIRVRSDARVVALWTVAALMYMEFGSMSWKSYVLFHKEPRYLAFLSVPFATIIGIAIAALWEMDRKGSVNWAKVRKGLAALTICLVCIDSTRTVRAESQIYRQGRDFLPALDNWLIAHPTARLWVDPPLQIELDLTWKYRFADPVHRFAGDGQHGAIQDLSFWHQAHAGDYVVVVPGSRSERIVSRERASGRLKMVEYLRGPQTTAVLYEVR